MNSVYSSWSNIFIAHVKRDILTNSRSLIDLISIVGFMILIIILFPLGLGPIQEKLNIVSNAVIWVGLILAIIPSLEKILQKDFENGWLDQIATSPIPLEIVMLSKGISYWLIILIPLIITSPIFAILLDMDLKNIPWLVISISAGSLAISLIGLSGSALILGARRGNILLPILIIPLMTPILIFGVGVNEAIKINASPYGNLFLLLALTLVYLVISPFISALLVRIAIGR
ncbi:MAG: heme exporter protein CcmB [SAR116 cluster bacterium]|nr:heme exporter protein CcmB [SAR116 cluster bacterium]|tara:strand:- start:952 stop:1644 length:693 start_codon:yes stop_codon:yes gene_type:complete